MIKKNLRLNSLVKAIVLAGIIVSTSLPVLANKNALSNTNAPVVEFISTGENGTLLSVQYKNEQKQKFTVVIRDEYGNTIYRKESDAENFGKTFQLVNENKDNYSTVTLVLIPEEGSNYTFNINTSFEVVKKVEVNKI